jgi:hypothetical protein
MLALTTAQFFSHWKTLFNRIAMKSNPTALEKDQGRKLPRYLSKWR